MKKLMIAFAVVALALGAQAENTWYIRVSSSRAASSDGVNGQIKFTAADIANYYTAYSLSDATASELITSTGGTVKDKTNVTAAEVQTWLDSNYAKNSAAWMAAGNKANSYLSTTKMYNDFDNGGAKYASQEEAYAANRLMILFYSAQSTVAGAEEGDMMNGYRVVGLVPVSTAMNSPKVEQDAKGDYLLIPSSAKGDWSDDALKSTDHLWAYSAPEPTSGMLMLLGLAGLALKRKRA